MRQAEMPNETADGAAASPAQSTNQDRAAVGKSEVGKARNVVIAEAAKPGGDRAPAAGSQGAQPKAPTDSCWRLRDQKNEILGKLRASAPGAADGLASLCNHR